MPSKSTVTKKSQNAMTKNGKYESRDYKKSPVDMNKLALAKSIGLDEIPAADPNAIMELDGILQKKFSCKNLDPVELIREIRGR